MKRLLILLVALHLLCIKSHAADGNKFSEGDFTYYVTSESEGRVMLTGYKGTGPDVVIPSQVKHGGATYSVTAIQVSAFERREFIKSVMIPNSDVEVDPFAFTDCSSLKTVSLPCIFRCYIICASREY